MTGSIRTRLAAALGTLALAAGGAVIAAPAAHASGPDCANQLAGGNPSRGGVLQEVSCKVGSAGVPTVSDAGCKVLLTQLAQMSGMKADSACSAARR
ncbi:hypothetical protein [Streptomyces morookaense]|uniref:Secreted protein n=1 Tax=Streptomyces morookaense TaxID=1970 RepID=A0A7Y7E8N1_STRMO|nr:hypothetical protein [Streptomyces morookaense]NVK80163.1 hypothetical protein [Streptomyces morookaense]GHF29191.1 hypothetical protein GCM10010359_34580 [Streptomyces morookaense]